MDLLWPAIKIKFETDEELVELARKLVYGDAGDKVKSVMPYVECHVTIAAPESGFVATFENYEIEFAIFTKSQQTTSIFSIANRIRQVFDHCHLPSGDFATCMFRRSGEDGPTLIDATYQMAIRYDVMIQRTIPVPVPGARYS